LDLSSDRATGRGGRAREPFARAGDSPTSLAVTSLQPARERARNSRIGSAPAFGRGSRAGGLFRRSEVVELVVFGTLAFTALTVVGVLLSVFSLVGWFLWLPFKILGWAFKLVGLFLALPFILIGLLMGGLGLFLGIGVIFLPLLPLFLAGLLVWWLVRSKKAPASASGPRSQAHVVS
jgi:hypothetical protein